MMNVADLLTRQALATPRAIAVIQGEREFSYASLEALVWGLCHFLRDHQLRSGEVVGLHIQNPLVHLAALLALARAGMIGVAVSTLEAELAGSRQVLGRTGASAILDDRRLADWRPLRRIDLDPELALSLSARPDERLRIGGDEGLMMYKTSSGTTGVAKIVGATHAGMLVSIERELACVGYPPGERYLTPVGLRFDGPRRRYLACLAGGATAVMPRGDTTANSLLALIDRHRVRNFSCVSGTAFALARAAAPGRQRLPGMRCFRLSAGPADARLLQLLRERLTSNLLISYGCTELGPLTVAPSDLLVREPASVGHAMPGVEVQIVAADGGAVLAGAVGHIRLRATGMPVAYHQDAAATARAFRDGWFYPGDLGRMTEDGLLFHMGRCDDMMVMDGVNIYPAEIEQAMLSHPAVVEAVALPLKHGVLNDVPVCALVLGQGRDASEKQLLAFARKRLGLHSPQRIVLVDAIPRNEHGKVARKALAQLIVSRLAAGQPDSPGAG